MRENFIILNENDFYSIYGGRSQGVADAVELIGMGVGILVKLINKLKQSLKDSQKKKS